VAESISEVVLAVLMGYDCNALACVNEVRGCSVKVELQTSTERAYYVVVAGESNDEFAPFKITIEVRAYSAESMKFWKLVALLLTFGTHFLSSPWLVHYHPLTRNVSMLRK
jgi:hypothetical protein